MMRANLLSLGVLMIALLAGAAVVFLDHDAGTVEAAAATAAMPNDGDAADDPCIWVDAADPARSLVIGADKKGGLGVYDLAGRELQYLARPRLNNVDLRHGFPFPDGHGALVAGSNKELDVIDLFRVDPATRTVALVAEVPLPAGRSADGLCLYRSARTGDFHVFNTDKDGRITQMRLVTGPDGVRGEHVRDLKVASETEGCVTDDLLGHLFVAEENAGIWRFAAEPDGGEERTRVDRTGWLGHLDHDVEGLAIYPRADGTGWLIASSQGSDDVTVYRREGDHDYVGRFRVAFRGDLVTHTDGLDVAAGPLPPPFERGLLVVQDDENAAGNQNFKLVPWGAVAEALGLR